jgi:hypothetical protein
MTLNGLLFMSDNSIIEIPNSFSLKHNFYLYIFNLVACILISLYLKYKIISYQYDHKVPIKI